MILNNLDQTMNVYQELLELEHSIDILRQQSVNATNETLSRVIDLRQHIYDYKLKAKNYLDENQMKKAIKVYREEILPFLLENHTRDDEPISTCYRRMASSYYTEYKENIQQTLEYYQKALDIYEKQKDDFYTNYAGTLFMCYGSMATIYTIINNESLTEIYKQKAIDIYEKHKNQFHFIANPGANVITMEIRPLVELGY